ncbi:protein of unassigned function [Methylobacterium oryzae CBMB20]|uniref:Protein of unassigned function n=2 Tax=Methylobacterium oryzae TaxID=334852 RepID=A0A089NZW3_9HYPH|nr:protein of unassigned function [Methylobacterium oryzae CBMB20]
MGYLSNKNIVSRAAWNDRIRYRATFLNTIGTSLVMLGFFLPGIRLWDQYDHRLAWSEVMQVSLAYIRTEPGFVSFMALAIGLSLHLLAVNYLGKLQD